jgi:hypothetical protein
LKLVLEHINEKFIEDSDPISDMGIGQLQVGDYMKLKKNLKYNKKQGNEHYVIGMYFSGKKL